MLAFKVVILALYIVLSLICIPDATTSRTHIYAAPYEYPALAPAPEASPCEWVPAPSPESPGMNPASHCNHSGVFDVTSYGAVADGVTETSSAFLAAWDDACAYDGNATLLIPNGTFFIGPVSFDGPCHNNQSPMIQIRGVLKAPSSLDAFPASTWIMFRRLHGFNLTGKTGTITLDGQGAEGWALGSSDKQEKRLNRPTSLKFVNITSGIIKNIALSNSKNFHMSFLYCNNVVVKGVHITSPWDSPNTDGIHISSSANINITSSRIQVGDDCVSIGPGNTNISILNVTCGPGHGISVGSLGKYPKEENVTGVMVKNCTINGTQNGVRVKTWPGAPASMASNLTFEDIVMINVSNPIIIDQEYCPNHTCLNPKPSLVKLRDIYFRNINGTSRTKSAVTLVCSSSVPCENIHIVDVKLNYTTEGNNMAEASPLAASFKVKGALHGVEILV